MAWLTLPFCRNHWQTTIICINNFSRCIAVHNLKSFKMAKIYRLRKTNRSTAVFSDNFVTYLAPWDVSDIPTPPRQFATHPPPQPHFILPVSSKLFPLPPALYDDATSMQRTTRRPPAPLTSYLENQGQGNLCPRIHWNQQRVPAYTIFQMCNNTVTDILLYPTPP